MTSDTEPNSLVELVQRLKSRGVPEAEYQTHVDRYLEFKARASYIPLTGHFELTPLCNLDCKMCYVHLSASQFSGGELLSIDQWKHLMKSAKEAGMLHAGLTGGECLTYPGFDELYLYLLDMGIVPGILTNGILVDEERVEFFVRHRPDTVRITLYGSSNDAYERVTGHRVFDVVCNNIAMLRDANIPVSITITPNSFMSGDGLTLLETAASLGVPYNINANLIPPRDNTGRATYDLPIDDYVELYKMQSAQSGNEPHAADPIELPDVSHDGVSMRGMTCGGGRSSFGITYEGSMCPCLSMGEVTTRPLEVGFEVAWRQLNAIVDDYPQPMECGNCIYKDRCIRCVAMHKNAPVAGHCDPRICERTKKLTKAGFIPVPKVGD